MALTRLVRGGNSSCPSVNGAEAGVPDVIGCYRRSLEGVGAAAAAPNYTRKLRRIWLVHVAYGWGDAAVGIHWGWWIPAQFVVPVDAFDAQPVSDDVAVLVSLGHADPMPMRDPDVWRESPPGDAHVALLLAYLPSVLPQRRTGSPAQVV